MKIYILEAAGYIACVPTDINLDIYDTTGGLSQLGKLKAYNNADRVWVMTDAPIGGSEAPVGHTIHAVGGTGQGVVHAVISPSEPILYVAGTATKWITIYSTQDEDNGLDVRVAEKIIPFRAGNIFQFLERVNRVFNYGGIIHAEENSTDIINQLRDWYHAGAGLKSDTLILVNSEGSFTVFIRNFSFKRKVGWQAGTYSHILELVEVT